MLDMLRRRGTACVRLRCRPACSICVGFFAGLAAANINVGHDAAVVTIDGLQPGASFDALYPHDWQPLYIDEAGKQSILLRPQSVAVFGRFR